MNETRLRRWKAKVAQWRWLQRLASLPKQGKHGWTKGSAAFRSLWTKSITGLSHRLSQVCTWTITLPQRVEDCIRSLCTLLRRYPFLSGILALAIFSLALRYIPQWQIAGADIRSDKERLELIDKARGTLAQIIAGLGIAVGLYFTWRRIAAAERTVQVTEEGQITERFTRAIDQLGATDEQGRKRLEIRLGGIYALERIARDSPKDHWPIMEVLTAYVREHAPWPAGQTTEESFQHPQSIPTPAPDIQAILTVLGRRTRWYGKDGEEKRLDLRKTDLRRADLRGAHLEGTILISAHLEAADLRDAHLEATDLWDTHLQGAHLEGAYLNGAYPDGTHIEGADLWGAHGLTQEQIERAYIRDNRTQLPDYLSAPVIAALRARITPRSAPP
jgi:hypothetical protein